jgi:hypothetical protein
MTSESFITFTYIEMANPTNSQALKEAFMNIEKQFGKGAVMRM